jgi:hypothetical protein
MGNEDEAVEAVDGWGNPTCSRFIDRLSNVGPSSANESPTSA